MQTLAQNPGGTASFTERQTSPILSTPLLSSGTLSFTAPNYLRKTTISPAPQSFILDHGKVTLISGGTTHLFTLNQDPRIAGLVEAIRSTLTGNLPALEQFYTVNLTGTAAAWQMQLLPKDAALAHVIRAITISGTGAKITIIDTASADGSDSRMSISPQNAE